jgi:hypothetical protein
VQRTDAELVRKLPSNTSQVLLKGTLTPPPAPPATLHGHPGNAPLVPSFEAYRLGGGRR